MEEGYLFATDTVRLVHSAVSHATAESRGDDPGVFPGLYLKLSDSPTSEGIDNETISHTPNTGHNSKVKFGWGLILLNTDIRTRR